MTAPRRVLPGTSYLVTRRCSERRFFLKPSRTTTEIFLYVLAVAAQRYDILVHAACVLSNHAHLVVTDTKGQLPRFMQYLDSLVARAVNASIGRFEGFWAKDGSYSAVEPIGPQDVVAKAAYVLANPVAAFLVRHGAEWPGLWTAPEQIGGPKLLARRPQVFFDPKSHLPATAELELTAPPRCGSPAEFREALSTELRALEAEHQAKAAREGRRFLGLARILAQSPFASPPPGEPRFELNPRIAGRDKWRRIEAIFRLKSFLQEYRKAWHAWRAGDGSVLFPPGTYLVRVMYGAPCAAAP
jgi:REP element-mobilizing transposase RayT